LDVTDGASDVTTVSSCQPERQSGRWKKYFGGKRERYDVNLARTPATSEGELERLMKTATELPKK